MAAAAQSALPGEALYPVKRGIEKAEAGLSLGSAGRGRDLLAPGRPAASARSRAWWPQDAADRDAPGPRHPRGVHRPGPRGLRPAAGLLRRRPATPQTVAARPRVRGHQPAHRSRADADRPAEAQAALRDAALRAARHRQPGQRALRRPAATCRRSTCRQAFLASAEVAPGPARGRGRPARQQPPGAGAPRPLRAIRQPSGRTTGDAPRRRRAAPGALRTGGTLGSLPRRSRHRPPRASRSGACPPRPPQRARGERPDRRDQPRRRRRPSLPDPSLSDPSLPDRLPSVPSLPVTGDRHLGTGLGDRSTPSCPTPGASCCPDRPDAWPGRSVSRRPSVAASAASRASAGWSRAPGRSR